MSRTSYYCPRTIRTKADELLARQLRAVHEQHPFYGVERLAIHLGWSEAKTRRIRNLAGIVVPTATKKCRYRSGKSQIPAPPNILHRYAKFKDENRPQDGMDYSGMVEVSAWVQDFTYLWFERSMHYLAVVLDLKTRQLVGWRLGLSHSSDLICSALLDALSKHVPPAILHSDQGSEYLSYRHQEICDRLEIQLSASAKASPWQNGFMERWFGGFKKELGPLNQFKDLAQLHEALALQVHYYNHERIHSALGMSPAAYAVSLKGKESSDKVFAKVGG